MEVNKLSQDELEELIWDQIYESPYVYKHTFDQLWKSVKFPDNADKAHIKAAYGRVRGWWHEYLGWVREQQEYEEYIHNLTMEEYER